MRIDRLLRDENVTISCELFPPKAGQPLDDAKRIVRETVALAPTFISVTCGAGGSTAGNTVEIASEAEHDGAIALAHVICMGSQRQKIDETLSQLRQAGIENILALRGDVPPTGEITGDFRHASELTEYILQKDDFCVGGACYPEMHPESATIEQDMDGLKRKVDAGCAFLTTQMFFDNSILYSFLYRLLKRNVNVPVLAGIMPVTNAKQIDRIVKLSSTVLPRRFRSIVDRFGANPAAMKQAGIAYATDQIIDLIANGVNNIHIYTMNKPDIAGSILRNLSEIFR